MSWQAERRADQAADREQARLDLAAAAERREADRARQDERRDAREQRAEARAQERRDERARRRQARRDRIAARRAALAAWLSRHVVELLVYPLAAVSAAMAIPAMAGFGHDVFGPTGYSLPALSELGMWAFAFAIQASRARHPDRPTVWLAAGVVVFAAVGAGLNFAHGVSGTDGSVVHGAVMAVVSIAGVTAHQLAVAAPPRSRTERDTARLDRLTRRRLDRARRAAARRAVFDLDAAGTVTLVHAPGRFTVRRRELRPATVPGLPVDPADDWDDALADLLDAPDSNPTTEADLRKQGHAESGDESGSQSGRGSGRVALADPSEPTGNPIDPQARRRLTPAQERRAALRFARRKGGRVTAEELRRELGVAAKTARELRDQVNAELFPNGGAS